MVADRLSPGGTADPAEVAQLAASEDEWWNPSGPFAALHQLNPVRLGYIRDRICGHFDRTAHSLTPLKGLRILDLGCGGGLLSEPLARMGATVTGIDAGETNIHSARMHAEESGLEIDYRHATVEELCTDNTRFDAVLAMEVVEHVADIDLFLDGCSLLAKEGGILVLSTLNRTPKAFLLGIVVAEYVLRWLPRGTHQWNRFTRPSELARILRRNGLLVSDISGLSYDLAERNWFVSDDVSVNYLISAVKP